MTLLVIAAMLITPLSVFAAGDAAPAGPQQLRGRALIDTITPLQFPNQIAPRDDSVTAQAAGVPVGARWQERQAAGAAEPAGQVAASLAETAIFGDDLAAGAEFAGEVTAAYELLRRSGVRTALASLPR